MIIGEPLDFHVGLLVAIVVMVGSTVDSLVELLPGVDSCWWLINASLELDIIGFFDDNKVPVFVFPTVRVNVADLFEVFEEVVEIFWELFVVTIDVNVDEWLAVLLEVEDTLWGIVAATDGRNVDKWFAVL